MNKFTALVSRWQSNKSLMRGAVFTSSIIIVAMFFLMSSAHVMAWSEKTHMTTGAIAFEHLMATHPELMTQIDTIIQAHPDYLVLSSHVKGLTGHARTRTLFEWLSRWADDIRETPESYPEWHYELKVVHGWTWLWPFSNGTASEAFVKNLGILSNRKAANKDRAIALSWLMHIVGDIQQPLHAGHQITAEFPLSDEAGSLAYIRTTDLATPVKLHEYIDSALDSDCANSSTSDTCVEHLRKLWPPHKFEAFNDTNSVSDTFEIWLQESRLLARQDVYIGNFINASPLPNKGPVLSQEEQHNITELAKRRVAASGYRIAETIIYALVAR